MEQLHNHHGSPTPAPANLPAERHGEAMDAILGLFDAGTFTQIGAYVKGGSGANREAAYESVITGYGSVDGRPVFAFAQDPAEGGVMTTAQADKICRLYELALRSHAPVVGIFSGNGAAIEEGTALLSSYAALMACVSKAKGCIPQIALISGICAGSDAILASMFDIRLMTKDSLFFIGSPFVLREQDPQTKFGSIDFCTENGSVNLVASDVTSVRKLLAYLPSENAEGNVILPCGDDINAPRTVTANEDAAEIAAQILDAGSLLTLGAYHEASMLTALGVLNDRVVGVVANQAGINEGRITAKGARKAAAFLELCGAMRLPVITLVNSAGTAYTKADETSNLAGALSELAAAYASCKTPLITLVTGQAIGCAFAMMGSRRIGADVVYAMTESKIGAMTAQAGTELTMKDRLKNGESRKELEAIYTETVLAPQIAAQMGEVDEILPPDLIRQKIAAAIEMLAMKEGRS